MAGSFDRKKFDYSAAAAQLYDEGECRDPDEIYEYTTEQGLRSFLGDYGLRFENYYDRPPRGDKRAYNEWVKEHEKKDEEEESNTDTGCFLTSACVRARNLPDNCEELTVLRAFRDGYMRTVPEGNMDIETYYRIAPMIVKQINLEKDSDSIWNRIYDELIRPCVDDIKSGKHREAYQRYKEYVLLLQDEFLPVKV